MCYRLKTRLLLIASMLMLTWRPSYGEEAGGAVRTSRETSQKPAAPIAAPAHDPCMNDSGCRQLVSSALEASRGRRFAEALGFYQGAYAQQAVPWLLINIGRTQQKLGRTTEAIATYTSFLEVKGAGASQELHDRVAAYLQQAQRELASKPADGATVLALEKPHLGPDRSAPLRQPVYRKWWFWTAVGAVAAGAAIGAGLGFYAREPDISGLSILQALRK